MILAGLDKRVILAGLIIVLLVVVNLASSSPPSGVNGPIPQEATTVQAATVSQEAIGTRTPLPTEPPRTEPPAGMQLATPTPTPLPAELLDNFQQTNGIIIVAGMLVLIVAAGVFNQLISERQLKH
jgi:hypothetical protein